MMGNGYGDVRVDLYQDLAAYDRAPPRLRWLMRSAVSPWSSAHVLDLYWDLRDEGLGHQAVIDNITLAMQRGDAHETLVAYGPSHPEAPPVTHEVAA